MDKMKQLLHDNGGLGPVIDEETVRAIMCAIERIARERHSKDFSIRAISAEPGAPEMFCIVPSAKMVEAAAEAVKAGKETIEGADRVMRECTIGVASKGAAERIRMSVMIHMTVNEIAKGLVGVEGMMVQIPQPPEAK